MGEYDASLWSRRGALGAMFASIASFRQQTRRMLPEIGYPTIGIEFREGGGLSRDEQPGAGAYSAS